MYSSSTLRYSLSKFHGSWRIVPRQEWLRKNGKRKPALYQSTISCGVVLPMKPPASGALNGTPESERFTLHGIEACR